MLLCLWPENNHAISYVCLKGTNHFRPNCHEKKRISNATDFFYDVIMHRMCVCHCHNKKAPLLHAKTMYYILMPSFSDFTLSKTFLFKSVQQRKNCLEDVRKSVQKGQLRIFVNIAAAAKVKRIYQRECLNFAKNTMGFSQ